MGIDFESLPGEGKSAKIRVLIAFCQRRGRLDELAERVRACVGMMWDKVG